MSRSAPLRVLSNEPWRRVTRRRRAQRIWVYFRGALDKHNAVRRAADLTAGCAVASHCARCSVQRALQNRSTRSMRDRTAACDLRDAIDQACTHAHFAHAQHARHRHTHAGAFRADREPSASFGDRRLPDRDCTRNRTGCAAGRLLHHAASPLGMNARVRLRPDAVRLLRLSRGLSCISSCMYVVCVASSCLRTRATSRSAACNDVSSHRL